LAAPCVPYTTLFRSRTWHGGALGEWLATEAIAIVFFHQPGHVWADWDNLGRVNFGVHHKVVLLDFGEISGVTKAGDLENFLEVSADIGHLRQLVAGALEVAVVDRIKADEGNKQANIGLGDVIADHIPLLA